MEKRGQRMRVCDVSVGGRDRNAQEARSTYTPLESSAHSTLVQVQIHTGVRHQIRAHLASLGHPIIGDSSYGAPAGSKRLSLHAASLRFVRPETREPVHLTSPLPKDFFGEEKSEESPERKHGNA